MRKFTDTNVVYTREHLEAVVARVQEVGAFVFDTETFGPNRLEPTLNDVVWMSIATEGLAVAIPFGHPNGNTMLEPSRRKKNRETGKMDVILPKFTEAPEQLPRDVVFEILKPLFIDPEITKVAHNMIFDAGSITKYLGGARVVGPLHDTLVIQHLLNENLLQYGLKELTDRYYKVKYDHEEVGKGIEMHEFWKVAHYAYMDARYTWLIWKRLLPLIEKAELSDAMALELTGLNLDWPGFSDLPGLIEVLIDMRLHGVFVNEAELKVIEKDMEVELAELEKEIYKLAGRIFNVNSNAQLAEVLFSPKKFGGQGITAKVLTKGGNKKKENGEELGWKDYSTASETLEVYAGNPLVDLLLKYSKTQKLYSAFVQSFLYGTSKQPGSMIHNGRIHGSFKQAGTVTGRFAASNPNLQQLPRPGDAEDDWGKRIRGLFYAPEGYKLIVSDYDQIEVRILAHFAGPGPLQDSLRQGVDPHSAVAAALIGMAIEEFMKLYKSGDKEAKKYRQVAKALAFAIIYGAGADKVSSMVGISVMEAKAFIELYYKTFPEVQRFKDQVIKDVKSRRPPHIKMMFGRKRRLPEIFSLDRSVSGRAERQAVNSLIQGTSGMLTKAAMCRLHKKLDPDMKLLLTVHDELVVLSPENKVEKCSAMMQDAMVGPDVQALFSVPISADLAVVDNWAQAKG